MEQGKCKNERGLYVETEERQCLTEFKKWVRFEPS